MVLHKIVNSTNVVFHMLDLQPYAMILPMDKLNSEKNKKKIMSKVLKNNPDTYAVYKAELKELHLNNLKLVKKKGSKEKTKEQDFKTKEDLNGEESKMKEDPPKVLEEVEMDSLSKRDETNLNDVEVKTDYEEESAVKPEDESVKDLEEGDQESDDDTPVDMFTGVRRFIDRIDNRGIIGCIIILAQKGSDKSIISPIAGGIVEVFDDYERSIQTMWLNNNITKYVTFTNLKGKKNSRKLINSLNDHILSKVVLSSLTLRLCAHAYQMTLPNSKRIQHKSRLISIYHQMGQTFPHFAYSFIKEEMQFSKHFEITSVAIKHNDNPRVPCKCQKPVPLDPNNGLDQGNGNDGTQLFFGITESRFTGMYTSTYEPILMGFMNLLSGKLNDISKLVRFEDEYGYQEENEYRPKRQKVTYRSKRLQNRM